MMIARLCISWKEGVGCVVHEPNQEPLKNPDCSDCMYFKLPNDLVEK